MLMARRRSGGGNLELILSKKVFVGSHLLQELLPKKALQLASPLSNEDKEVLAYLVAFGQHITGASSSPVSKLPWRRWKSPSSKSSKQQHSLPPDACAAEVYLKRRSFLPTIHSPSFSCDCFACYASFWSRWEASFNRDIINQVLDEVEICPETSKGKRKKKKKQDKRKLTPQDEGCVIKHIEEDGGLQDHYVHVTEDDSCPSCWDFQSLEGAFTAFGNLDDAVQDIAAGNVDDAMRERAKSSVDYVGHTSSNDMMNKEAPKIVTKLAIGSTAQPGPEKAMCREGNLSKEASDAADVNDEIVGKRTREENEDDLPSGVVGSVFCRAPNAKDKEDSSTMQASEAMFVGLSLVCMQGKTIPRLRLHHRTGKRKSNQVMPLDYDVTVSSTSELEVANVSEDLQAPLAARVADFDLGGRGFLARIFPDALGRVASQLWDLVSVRLRTRTMEYH